MRTSAGCPIDGPIAGLVAFGLVAIAVDLVLIDHVADWLQLLPVAMLPLGAAAIAWWLWLPSEASRRALRAAMLLVTLLGVSGIAVHFYESREFRREVDPSLSGFALVLATLRTHSPPSLAPGNIALLGLVGLLLTFGARAVPRAPSVKEPVKS